MQAKLTIQLDFEDQRAVRVEKVIPNWDDLYDKRGVLEEAMTMGCRAIVDALKAGEGR